MNPLLIGPIFDIAGKVFDRIFPDKTVAEKAKAEFAVLAQTQEFQVQLAQIAVNAEEAKSTNWFVAGWRPCIGWIGALALGYAAVLEPVARFIALVAFGYTGIFPVIDTNITMQILFGILGLGAYRSFEKHTKIKAGM